MAKSNSIDSIVNVQMRTPLRFEGQLVEANASFIRFKARKSGGRRMIEKNYPLKDVIAYSETDLVVITYGKLPRQVFRPISGVVNTGKDGWLVVDGLRLNPEFVQIETDHGVEDGGAAKKTVKKKKKA